MLKFLNVEDIAKAAHAATTGYHDSFAEFSVPSWNELSDIDRQTNCKEVVFIIKNPTVDPIELYWFHVDQLRAAGLPVDTLPLFSDRNRPVPYITLSLVKSLGHLVDPVELARYDMVK
jgi:hypothetical protein